MDKEIRHKCGIITITLIRYLSFPYYATYVQKSFVSVSDLGYVSLLVQDSLFHTTHSPFVDHVGIIEAQYGTIVYNSVPLPPQVGLSSLYTANATCKKKSKNISQTSRDPTAQKIKGPQWHRHARPQPLELQSLLPRPSMVAMALRPVDIHPHHHTHPQIVLSLMP